MISRASLFVSILTRDCHGAYYLVMTDTDMYSAIEPLRNAGWLVVDPQESLFEAFAYKPTPNTESIRISMAGYEKVGGVTRLEVRTACMSGYEMANGSFNAAWGTMLEAGAIRESSDLPGRFSYVHTESPLPEHLSHLA